MKNIVTMTFEELLLALEEHSNLISNETKIGHNTNVRVGMLGKKVAEILRKQGDTGEKYLSKIDDDTAQGIITFLKAILIGDFSPGLLGSGGAIRNINGTTVAEFDQLLIRQRAEFFSALIHQAKHIGGELVQSAAEMICIKVEETTDFYRCYFDADDGKVVNLFENTDFARHQVFTGSKQKFYWRKVVAVGPDYIELSKTNAAINSDIPEVGDYIYQLGSENTERQGAIILSTVGPDAPSIKQYVNINTYALSSENEYTVFSRMGNKIQGKTVFRSNGLNYDDWADGTSQDIQDAQEAANAAALAAQQAIDDAAANVTDYNAKFAEMQAQVDGEISNYSYPYTPTLLNYPASDWATDIEKDRHIGDVFHNSQAFVDNETTPDSGKAWRFVKNGTAYSWTPIADSDAVKAIQEASKAQAMADGKSTTFLITPSNYKLGDMWVLNADQTVNGTAYKAGEILTATQDSATFVQAHWVKRVRYTDDTKANQVASSLTNFTETVFPQEKNQLQSQIDGKIETHFTASDPATAWTTADLKTKHTGDMWFNSTTKKLNRYSGSAWVLIEDQKAIDAFNTASTAKDTADGKRRVFTATPTVPYDVGDLWAQGTGGDLMRCITAKTSAQTYSVADWEKASKYTDDTAVENLQIGGVNLIDGTSEDWKTTNIANTWSYPYGGSTFTPMYSDVKEGTYYTFSVEVKDIPLRTKTYIRFFDSNNQVISNHGSEEWTEANTESLLYTTGKAPTGAVSLVLSIAIESIAPNTTVYYRKGQLETGNKRTDWDLSAKDRQAKIDQAKQEALNAANNVQTNVNSLSSYVDGAFKDGVIDEAEAKAIEKYLNTINEAMAKAEASFAKVFANTYLEGAAKTALENAKINLWGQRETLRTAINTAIAGGTTTPAQKTAVDNAFSLFNSLMSDFQSALEEANKAIQIKLDNLSKGYADDIEVGGRNLILNSYPNNVGLWRPNQGAAVYSISEGEIKIRGTGAGWKHYELNTSTGATFLNNLKEGYYTISGEVKIGDDNYDGAAYISFRIGAETTGQLQAFIPNESLTKEWQKISRTKFMSQADLDNGSYRRILLIANGLGTLSFRKIKLEKGTKATDWTEAKEDTDKKISEVDTRAVEALAKANISKAITDKFATEINGGLITTVMMLLREVNSQINTAGFSGIQGALLDQPSYWSGGTHEQAQAFVPFVKKLEKEQATTLEDWDNLPKIVFLHSGAAKVGHFIVLTSGEILIIDPATGTVKLKFTTAELTPIADLVFGVNSQDSTAVGAGVASTSSSQVVSGSTVVSKNGAIATFNGTHISLSARGIAQAGGMASFAEAVLYARQNGVRVVRLASVTVHFTDTVYEDKSAEVSPVPFSFPVDAGTYTFELAINKTGNVSSGDAVTSASTLSWKHTVVGVKKQQYSKDGMMFFYSNRHFYFNELTGLDVKESDSSKFNMPGVLLSATVAQGGGHSAVWGPKQSASIPFKNSTGRYTVYHTVGHSNYQVNAASKSANRSFHIVSQSNTNFVIEWRTIGSSPALADTAFDFQIFGNNYP